MDTARLLENIFDLAQSAAGDVRHEGALRILIDLYRSEALKRPVTVGDACTASGMPSTTALRLIQRLHQEGYILRLQDHRDERRRFLSLTARSRMDLERLFDGVNGLLQR